MICTLYLDIFFRTDIALLLRDSNTNDRYMIEIAGDKHGIYNNISV